MQETMKKSCIWSGFYLIVEFILIYLFQFVLNEKFLYLGIVGIIYCIFRKNCASVPEERSAIPLQTEQSSAG